jgi:Flp pilus assembly protein TadD
MADPAQIYTQLLTAFNQRNWTEAKLLSTQLLPMASNHSGVHYMAGIASLELEQVLPALTHLHRAETLEPTRVDFVVQYAKALSLARRSREAKVVADRALALESAEPATLDTLGVVYAQIGDYDNAVVAFRRAVSNAPEVASYRYNLGTSLVAAGDLDAAEIEIEACLERDPAYWRAHLTLSQLRRQSATSNHVARLESLLPHVDPANVPAQICVNMALFKEYEDLADYPKAFAHLARGKAAGGNGRHYSIEHDEALFAAIMESFPEPITDSSGCMSGEPIFVMGMPRTGTTLVERIISSHPDVHSAGELLNFGMSLKFLSGTTTPMLIDLPTIVGARQSDPERLGETYLASTRPGTSRKPRFIDKLPHNFLYAGFIARALPNARIVCLRRDPVDTCLSNFRQLFAPKSPYFDYSYDLLDTGRYYVLFDRLIAHWQKMLPGRVFQIGYEDLVEQQEDHSRELLAFCGLEWNAACLRFEENPSPVATASAVQVRAPIYRNALKRWKKYEPQLGELLGLLETSGIKVDR